MIRVLNHYFNRFFFKRVVTIFFLLFTTLKIYSQNNVEKLFSERKYKEVIKILNKKEEIKELNLRDYFLLAKSYARIRSFSNGYTLANKMIALSVEKKDTLNLLKAYNIKAENIVDLNNVLEGVFFCDSIIPQFRKKDSIELQKLCFKCGILYYYNKEHKKAYESYNKIKKKEYKKLKLFTHNYALILMGLEKWDEALLYQKKALKDAPANKKGDTFSNIGLALVKQERWKEAEIYLDSAKLFFSADTTSTFGNYKILHENYLLLYKGQKKVDKAIKSLEQIRILDKDIFRENLNEEVEAIKNSDKRERILKKRVTTVDNKLATSEKQKLWGAVILLSIIVTLLTMLFLYTYKNIKTKHENVLTEQKLLRSQMTPHFIFNSLSVLQGMILNKEDKKAVRYLSTFSKLLRLILECSREKLVTLEEELAAIQNYVDLQNLGAKKNFKYTVNLSQNVQNNSFLVPPMLIQPFVENTIIHGFKEAILNPKITIEMDFIDKKLICLIKDNGIGVNKTKVKTSSNKKSLATKITLERLKIISREFKVDSNLEIKDRSLFNEEGTQVKLTLPYKIEEDD